MYGTSKAQRTLEKDVTGVRQVNLAGPTHEQLIIHASILVSFLFVLGTSRKSDASKSFRAQSANNQPLRCYSNAMIAPKSTAPNGESSLQ